MFQAWRLQLREAEEAFQGGRLDEAGRLLSKGRLREFLPGKRLTALVSDRMAQRARQHSADGNSSAGWRDLEAARSLAGETDEVAQVRRELITSVLSEAESYLRAGDYSIALSRLDTLLRREINGARVRSLRQVVLKMQKAGRLARKAKFPEAEQELLAAEALRPDLNEIQQQRQKIASHAEKTIRLSGKLHRQMTAKKWTKSLALADRLLALVPEFELAQQARRKAWRKVAADSVSRSDPAKTQPWVPSRREPAKDSAKHSTGVFSQSVEVDTVLEAEEYGTRFLMWVDAVGGFLVCMSDEIMLGQAVPSSQVEVPILADLSRRHAKIRRDGEGYLIEPTGNVFIEGRKIKTPTLLSHGDEIQLGNSVRIRFRRPHALSASARLDFVSHHRVQPSVDAVLLMAESCILGPQQHDHVLCRDWPGELVLFRRGEQLICKAPGPIEIDGESCQQRGVVSRHSRITGEEFSLSLEEI